MSPIGIFGASGMAREAADIAYELGLEPVYVVRDQTEAVAFPFPGRVILESDIAGYEDMSFVIAIGDNSIRQRIVEVHGARLDFVSLIHPSASFGAGQRELVEAKRGVIVCAGVRFTNNIEVGDFCIFNLNSTISHDVILGDYVYVAPGAHIVGNVHVKTKAWIGTGAVINQGTGSQKRCIGEGATIGAGAVVVADCHSNATYVGVPARRVN